MIRSKMSRGQKQFVSWVGRFASLLVIGSVATIAIGEGVPDPGRLTLREGLQFLGLFASCLGLGLAWRWEGAGAVLSLLGLAGFALVEFLANGRPPGWAFSLMAVPGVLFLLSR